MFEDWCALRDVQPLPAAPKDVATFVSEIAPLGITEVWDAVGEISRAHYLQGLADPTLGGWVSAAIQDIAKLAAPRSWPKDEWPRFHAMPYDLQLVVLKRETERDIAVRHAQNEAGRLRNELAAIQQTPKVTDGNPSHTSA